MFLRSVLMQPVTSAMPSSSQPPASTADTKSSNALAAGAEPELMADPEAERRMLLPPVASAR